MKKLYSFFKSMRFGLILLVLIAVCSVIGSIIPQDKEISWYVQNYQDLHGVILLCKAHRIFQSWYFIVLLALLSLNLLLCTVTRLRTLLSTRSGPDPVTYSPDEVHLSEAGMSMLHEHLTRMRCRESRYGDSVIYRKNSFGRYGTFITHLSILLTVIFGAAALYLPTTIDQTCVPGESITMEDGTEIAVDSFHIENEYGDLDYASKVTVTLPNGKQSDLTEVSVNHPLSFGEYKIYQQTYGTAGSVTVRNTDTDGVEDTDQTTDTDSSEDSGEPTIEELQAYRDSLYVKEICTADLEILRLERKLAESEYSDNRSDLTKQISEMNAGSGTDGHVTVNAKAEGTMGQIALQENTSVYKGQYLFTVNREGEKLLRISMPKARGQVSQTAAKPGQRIELKTDDKTYMGTCVAVNGNPNKAYLFTRNGKEHMTSSAQYSAGQAEQFFVKMDDDSYYDDGMPSAVAGFQGRFIRSGITVPSRAVYSEKDAATDKTVNFVWKITEGGLVRQTVTVYESNLPGDEKLLLSGVDIGDKVVVE